MRNDIDKMTARDVYFVEIAAARREHDEVAAGFHFLHLHRFALADGHFAAAIASDPTDQRGHFGQALALLQGRRPHRNDRGTLVAVRAALARAPDLSEAVWLHELVAEDEQLGWRREVAPPDVLPLARRVDRDVAQLLLQLVPAPGAPAYEALRVVMGRV